MLETLIAALLFFAPESITADTARVNAAAALTASQETGVPVDLLLAMAYRESRYNPYALSRIQCVEEVCTRTTSVWTSDKRPSGSKPTFYCGVMQVGGWISWDECLAFRDVDLAFTTGAQHLVQWMNDPYCARLAPDDNLACALSGYGGGYAGIKQRPTKYARAVLHTQRQIARAIARVKVS